MGFPNVVLLDSALVLCVASPALGIVGGEPAIQGQFPYQVSIRNEGFGHIFSGTIVSPNLVVTAGACTGPLSPSIDAIVAGSLKRTEMVPWQQVRTANRTVTHPDFNTTTMADDLVLLFVNEPFQFNANISSIPLSPKGLETFPESVLSSGWGNVQYGEPMFEDLQFVTVDTSTDQDCEQRVGQPVLCIGADEGGGGGCQGDAGTGVILEGKNTSYVVAVGSHFPCPRPDCCGIPGPNGHCTELTFYIDWSMAQSKLFGNGFMPTRFQ